VRGRYDRWRSAVALSAALLAAIGAYSAYARLPVVPFLVTAVLLLGAEAFVGLALAIWPSGQWSRGRRFLSLVIAILGLVLMVPGPLIAAIVVPGCVCSAQPIYPSLLGIGHQYWIITGLVGSPVLLALAAVYPVRSRHAEMPPEPGASTEAPQEPLAHSS
jgi:hypothetical protein